ncbi:MAG: hypothetical protein ACKVOH_02050 [Chlamydiales bacterium]
MCAHRSIRKKSFLLLELVISLLLVTLCLFPLIRPLRNIQLFTFKQLHDMQYERLSRVALCDLKQQLFENRLSWEQLEKRAKGELPAQKFFLANRDELQVVPSYILTKREDCNKSSSGKHALLLDVEIALTKERKFHHTLLVEEHPP